MSHLPDALQDSLKSVTKGMSLAAIAEATQDVSSRYRGADRPPGPLLLTQAHRLAYLTTRFPATFEAVHAVLCELMNREPSFLPQRLLDLGAGPGTATWAATTVFSSINAATLVEQDQAFIDLGKRLSLPFFADWLNQNLTNAASWPAHDLVVMSYSLGELTLDNLPAVLQKAWRATGRALAILEPGTPRGYQTILAARDILIDAGAHLLAPCPHAQACPMQGTKDWCHFSCRLARTAAHRQAKGAELSYEDEKFSYLIFTRDTVERVAERVVRHPQVRPGHVNLELCTRQGLQKITVSKKQGDAYRWAKKAEWGDSR